MSTAVVPTNAGGAPATGNPNGTPGPGQTGGEGSNAQAGTPAAGGTSGGQTFTQAQLDGSFKAGREKAEGEYKPRLDALTREVESLKKSQLAGKPVEEQLKEVSGRLEALQKERDDLAQWREGTEKRLGESLANRAKALPEHLKAAYEAVSDASLDKREAVLANLEKAAGHAPGTVSPPGGNVGNRAAGLDIAGITAAMGRNDMGPFRKALASGVSKADLDRAMMEHRRAGGVR